MPLGREVDIGPSDIVLYGDRASPKGAQQPQFSAHVCCGQTAGWIKVWLSTVVDLGSGHIVLDGVQLPPRNGHSSPLFMHIVAKRSPISATAELLFGYVDKRNKISGILLAYVILLPFDVSRYRRHLMKVYSTRIRVICNI